MARHPVHVTLRRDRDLPTLHRWAVFIALRAVIAAASSEAFRIVHFAVLSNHVHLIVEADTTAALGHGLRSLAIRSALAINRALVRSGRVWADRYHTRQLSTPLETNRAIAYVLLNRRKHEPTFRGVDGFSSGPWFDGWTRAPRAPRTPSPVAPPRTWLLSIGWKRWGPLDPDGVRGR